MMKLMKYIVLLCRSFIATPATYADKITLVAEPGLPAPGFDPSYIYWNTTMPVIGRNGKIAFAGAADTSLGSTSNNTNAIWTGYPGQLHTIIKENESPTGFPPNIVFSDVQNGPMIVTGSGMVVAQAYFVGAVNTRGLIAEVDGSTIGIIKNGDQAPGYPNGVSLSISNFIATDAGVAFLATTTNGEIAIWFWDRQTKTIQLVANSSGDASAAYPGCSYFAIPFQAPYVLTMNDDGDIAFVAQLIGTGCPLNAIVRWNRGVLSPVVSKDDPVPGFPANVVTNGLVTLTGGLQINDAGAVTFQSQLRDTNTSTFAESTWIVHKNGTRELIVINQEILPNETIPYISQVWINTYTNGWNQTVQDVLTSNSFEQVILFGQPKTSFSYPDLVNVGTSHLGKLLGANDQPPGFGVTWFYDTISGIAINNHDTISVSALVKDATDLLGSATYGIWKGIDASTFKLVAKQGMSIKINGADETLTTVIPFTSGSTNGGKAMQVSDDGQILFSGASTASALGPSFPSSIFITNKPAKYDHNDDGMSDVILRHTDGRWFYFPMNGRSVITAQQGIAGVTNNNSWQYQGSGDYNGDGKADVLVRHSDGRWFYFPMNGRGVITAQQGIAGITTNNSWQYQGSGDMNGDGKDDVLVRHTDGRWFYFPMNGRSVITAQQGIANLTTNTAWQFAGMGDMNNDGKDDVLVRHTDGRWFYFPMNGRKAITAQQGIAGITTNTAWQFAGIGDMNGDYKDDVLVRHTDGRWFYFPMNGRNVITAQQGIAFLTTNTAWQFAGMRDMNGDGKDDVLTRHTDGRWFYFPMNGRNVFIAQQGIAGITTNTAWGLP